MKVVPKVVPGWFPFGWFRGWFRVVPPCSQGSSQQFRPQVVPIPPLEGGRELGELGNRTDDLAYNDEGLLYEEDGLGGMGA